MTSLQLASQRVRASFELSDDVQDGIGTVRVDCGVELSSVSLGADFNLLEVQQFALELQKRWVLGLLSSEQALGAVDD